MNSRDVPARSRPKRESSFCPAYPAGQSLSDAAGYYIDRGGVTVLGSTNSYFT